MERLPDVPRNGQARGIPWKREERLTLNDIIRVTIVCGRLRNRLAKRLCSELACCVPPFHLFINRHQRPTSGIEIRRVGRYKQFAVISLLISSRCGLTASISESTSRDLQTHPVPDG